ncbi:motilin receptor [Xenopus tropicalis]|uniref:Growth hormone secretagogue receptor type 1 n=1 Tax=Xenopus tropicalis TaxID=8364 RepID=A0A8J0QLD6_XENTR|nr:motilin receptor [Xenopus tropicalis]|eukprot:XP_002935793.1 PREDICTED: motilin receptor [Xenopus tropicalis]
MKNDSSFDSGGGNWDYDDIPECTEYLCSFFPITTLIPVTIVLLIVMVVGVIGNTITILIIRRYKEMRTTTNFYLSSMAMSDLIILLSLPFDLYRLWKSMPWIFGGFLCRFLHFISEGCTYSTILHITALSIERYLAICFPLKSKVLITKTRVKCVIVFLWVFALLSAGPFYFVVGIAQMYNITNDSDTGWECRYTFYAVHSGLLNVMMWVTTTYFFIPMFCLIILYGFIGKKLWKSQNSIRGRNTAQRDKSHRQTMRILAVVVLAFIICWLPFHIGRIVFANTEGYEMMKFSQYFNVVAIQLFYLSASINPILYNLISKKYRSAAYKLLRPSTAKKKTYNTIKNDTGDKTESSACVHNEFVTHI